MSEVHLSHPSPDRLAAYPLGRLEPAEAAAVAAHLAECPACRGVLDSLPPETLHSLARASTPSAPAEPAAAPPKPDALPDHFGPYRITRLLGRGGMGSVYLAHDPRLERPIALKVPHFNPADGAHVVERFYREARAAARIEHPNICQVYEVGEHDGRPYLAMRYVEGKSLASVVREGKPLVQRQAAALVGKLALALQEAHAHGVIHRDLKPSNVMLLKGREPVLMDFGLARQVDRADARLTHSGAVMGTPAYMAPEQAAGETDAIGPASDIYSLGVILYELLTGRLPFEGPVAVVLALVLVKEPERPSAHRPDLDPRLEAICLKAMAKKPADRYATMAEFAAALSAFLRDDTPRPATQVAGRPAGETQPAYQLAPEEATAPSSPPRQTAAAAGDSPKADGPRPRRKKGRVRRHEPKPSAAPRWLAVIGTSGALVVCVAVLAFVLIRARQRPSPAAPAAAQVAASVAPAPPAEPAPATTRAAPVPAAPTEKSAPAVLPPPAAAPTLSKNAGSPAGPPPRRGPAGEGGMMLPGVPARPATSLADAFRVRLVEAARATASWKELAGKPLTGVVMELEAPATAPLDCQPSSLALLTTEGEELPARLLFLPSGHQGLEAARYTSVTTRPGDVTVGTKKYRFENPPLADLGREGPYMPVFLDEGRGITYVFRPNRKVRVGLLFECAPDKADSVRVAGQDLVLNLAPAGTGPGATAGKEPAESPANPNAVEVYRFVAEPDPDGAASCNLTVTELPNGKIAVAGRSGGKSGIAATVTLPQRGSVVHPLAPNEELIVGANVMVPFAGPTTFLADPPGSTDLWVQVNKKVGHVTVAGLRFKDNCVIRSIRKDGVLVINHPGIRAEDEEGNAYVSQQVRLDGKVIEYAMVKVAKK